MRVLLLLAASAIYQVRVSWDAPNLYRVIEPAGARSLRTRDCAQMPKDVAAILTLNEGARPIDAPLGWLLFRDTGKSCEVIGFVRQ